MYRKSLIYCICIFGIIAIGFISAPFFKSLTPSEAALTKYPHFNISDLQLNQTVEFKTPFTSVFVTKTAKEASPLVVHYIPKRDGYYLLPEFDWSKPIAECTSFKFKEVYQCVEIESTEQCEENYQCMMKWDKNGKYIGDPIVKNKPVSDLKSPRYEIKGSDLILLQM